MKDGYKTQLQILNAYDFVVEVGLSYGLFYLGKYLLEHSQIIHSVLEMINK